MLTDQFKQWDSIYIIHSCGPRIQLQWNKKPSVRAVPPLPKNGTECRWKRDSNDGARERVRTRKKHSPKKSRGKSRPYGGGILGILTDSCIIKYTALMRSVASDQPSHRSETTTITTIIKIKSMNWRDFLLLSFFFHGWTHDLPLRAFVGTLTPTQPHTAAY